MEGLHFDHEAQGEGEHSQKPMKAPDRPWLPGFADSVKGPVSAKNRGTKAVLTLLVGMGLSDLRTNPSVFLEAKKTIRDMEFDNCQSVVRTACNFASPEEINRLIEEGGTS
jgi:hypothetical protein